MSKLLAMLSSVGAIVMAPITMLLQLLGALLSGVFGRVIWVPPSWMEFGKNRLAAPLNWLASHLGVVVVALALGGGLWLAKPMLTKVFQGVIADQGEVRPSGVRVLAPAPTDIEHDGSPRPVALEFSVSSAPLAKVGKEAPEITLKPEHKGKWTWISETRLEFMPSEEWPVGQDYTIKLGRKALAKHVKVESREFEFRSPSFEIEVRNTQFYQDPVQVSQRKAVYELHFSHPVNPADFEKRVQLAYVAAGSSLAGASSKFTLVFDKFKMNATLQSEPLAIPATNSAMVLKIAAGAMAQRGGRPTEKEITKAVEIPGLNSLAIEKIDTSVVTGDDGEPQHVLNIQSSMTVHEKEMARQLGVWLLPARKNADGEPGWSDPVEVDETVLKKATKLALTAIPQERDASETHMFRFKADPGSHLFIRVNQGLKSLGGYQLGAKSEAIAQVKAFAPELAIMSKGSLLALNGDKKLPVLVRDLPGVHVEIARLLPHQLHLLASQSDGSFSQPEFYRGLTPEHLTERFEIDLPFTHIRPGKTHYESVDFSKYLSNGSGERRGAFLLSVRGYEPKQGAGSGDDSTWGANNQYGGEGEYYEGEGEMSPEQRAFDPSSMKDTRLVLVTDLGFLIKKSVDGSRDVFVQSIASGLPVAEATVEIWGKNGLVLSAQKTDASGLARLPNLNGYTREKLPVMMVVKKGDDLSFMPLNRHDRGLDLSRFDIGGIVGAGLPNQTRAYIFSDRGIYRPGDTMNFGVVVKTGDWAQSASGLPVEAEVIDARGLSVKREKIVVGPGGMAEVSHASFDHSPTGNYTVNINLARDDTRSEPLQLGTTTVKVQEFMPDRMKISTKLSAEVVEGWVSPKNLKAKINVQNLFGAPAQNRRVETVLTLSPAWPNFRSYPDYAFFDPQRAKERFSEPLEKAETDAQGDASIDFRLERYAAATYQLHLLAKAFEPEGGRSVAAEATTLVSDLPYLVGFKSDGDLGYVSRNTARKIALIAIDPSARKTAVKNLKLQRVERKVLSVLVKQRSGLYKYESRAREVVLGEQTLTISETGFQLALDTATPGNFGYVIRNSDGLEMNRIEYSVAGVGNVSRSLDRNAELQLTLNKKDYADEEEIEVSIRAPYAGAGLITIERDKVYAHQWFKTDKTASVQRIRLPKGFDGNGYVMVQFVRDPASDEIYMSPLSYGVAPFATSLAARTTKISLSAPKLVKPGQTVKMRLESAQPARAVVYAVDEGILQVARYQNPDPLKFFFTKRALEVSTSQILDMILPEFGKLMRASAPGGDADGALGKHLNPFKRKTDKPVVYWSGIVEVNGSKEFSYTVPESFNGSLRVMAVAVNDRTAAAATAQTLVRGDLILLPNVPVALTPGDEVEVGIGLANQIKGSGKDVPIALTLQTSPQLEVLGAATQTLKVSERGEGATKFRIRARAGKDAKLGSASVIFTARYKEFDARLSTDLSVRPASTLVTLVQTGRFHGSGELKLQGDFYPNFQRTEFAASSSPWSFASGLIQYLQAYPHGCTEQITSQTFPWVILSTQPELKKEMLAIKRGAGQTDTPDPAKALARTIATLRSRQTAEGGFGLWDAGHVEPFANVYATHMLLEARERKLAVPEDMLQRSMGYLRQYLARSDSSRYDWRNRAYAAYLLTRQGEVTTAALVNLRAAMPTEGNGKKTTDLGVVWLAASYQMLKQDKAANELLEPVWQDMLERTKQNKRYAYSDYYYDPLVHDSMLVYLIARHFPAKLKQLPPETFDRIGSLVRDGWYHSLSSASVVLAVDAYSQAAASDAAASLKVGVTDKQGKVQTLTLGSTALLAKTDVPLGAAKLNLANWGSFPLYYALSESGYERNIPAEAQSKGLEIMREFIDAAGKPVSEARLGEEITVRLRVRSTDKSEVQNVAVADVLPGGLEPVLTNPADSEDSSTPLWRKRLGGSGSWAIQYADIREDRVLFYGHVSRNQNEVTYKVRATNVGEFVVPGAWGEAMYDRKIVARSVGGKFVIRAAN
ncbi:MAG: alpha-2-macroglobulin [Sulfuricellaceae bacterium]|nr:alpha-2-macroglobulin [Sulfuricellaceae bacterium]